MYIIGNGIRSCGEDEGYITHYTNYNTYILWCESPMLSFWSGM